MVVLILLRTTVVCELGNVPGHNPFPTLIMNIENLKTYTKASVYSGALGAGGGVLTSNNKRHLAESS